MMSGFGGRFSALSFACLLACGGGLSAWAQTAAPAPAAPLVALSDEVNSLVMSLGEAQIEFMQPLMSPTPVPQWNEKDLQRFQQRIVSATLSHPDVLASRAARMASTFGIREAQAAWYPQVSSQLDNGRKKSDPSAILGTPARDYNAASFTLTVRQLLYDFGASTGAIDASNARDQQSWFRQLMVEGDTAFKAIQAYHEVIRAERQLALARKNQQARESILDLVKQRQDIGGGTVSDVVRAQSRVAEAAAAATAAVQRLGSVQASYKEFFGAQGEALKAQSPLFDVNVVGSWRAELGVAGQENWKVRLSTAAKQAAEAELKTTQGRSLSSINLEVSNTRRDWVSPGVPGSDQSVMLVARQALYAGGADSARIAQSQQKLTQAQEELDSAKRESSRLLEQAVLEAESLGQLVESRRVAAELAAESLRMIREQYAYRRGTLLDLLTAQETLNYAGRDLIDAQVDRAMSTYRILNAAALLNRFMGLAAD